MTDPQEPEGEGVPDIESAVDMPDRPGQCAYFGTYIQDGETVCWRGEEYICRAPNLVKTGNRC